MTVLRKSKNIGQVEFVVSLLKKAHFYCIGFTSLQITSLRAEIEDLKEQLQAKEDELLQKDTELRKVQVQLRDSKSDFETFQVCQHELVIASTNSHF